MFIIEDIIWLNKIVEKLAWKHNVLPSEVEKVLGGDCKLGNRALIITARDMNQSERKRYGKKDKIKDMSVYDASDFWDEHDLGEFDDVQEVEDIKFSLKKKKYVGIDRDLYAIIKSKAKALNESEEVLINEWLSEKAGV